MAEVKHDGTQVLVDGARIGTCEPVASFDTEGAGFVVYQTDPHAEELRLDLPKTLTGFSNEKTAILDTVVNIAERQLALIQQGRPLTDSARNPLHPDLQPYLNDRGAFLVLQHPLVYSVPYTPERAHFCNARYKMQRAATEAALEGGNYKQYIALHERPYRLQAFYDICVELSGEDYWRTLAWVWTDSENIHQNYDEWCELWLSDEFDRQAAMDAEDRQAYDALPDTLTIYRGSSITGNLVKGLSWTTDRQKAEWFARRYTPASSPVFLAQATVAKTDVLAYFVGRNESEVVVDPSRLKMVKTRTLKAKKHA